MDTAGRHSWPAIVGLTVAGAVASTVALLAGAGVIVSLGAAVAVWLAAYLVARRRGRARAGSLVIALPAVLVLSIVLWFLIVYAGAGG